MIRSLLLLPRRPIVGRAIAVIFATVCLGLLVFSGAAIPATAQEPLEPADLPDAYNGLPLFADRCANCHGPNGQGDGEMASNLPKAPRDYTDQGFHRTAVPSVLFQTLTDGILEAGMPPFGSASSNPIDESGRWDLIAAVYSFGTPAEAIENGRVVYEENCLSCHGENGDGRGPDAADSAETPSDLTDLRYWTNRSNEMVFVDLQDPEVADHAYFLSDDDLWDVIDYSRTFSYVYADPQEATKPLEMVTVAGQVQNATTDEIITEGTVSLRAFTPDLQEALSQTTIVGSDGRYRFEVTDADPDWIYMASIDYDDLSYSSDPLRIERSNPQLELPIDVFDTTDDPSVLTFKQVHMIMEVTEERVQISEIYVLSNLEPVVFVGETGVVDEGTMKLALPDGAENVQFERSFGSFENFLPAPEVIPTDEGYADTVPIRPGDGAMNLLVSYAIPFEKGMTVEHPVFYETDSATVVIPGEGIEIEGDGWTTQGSQQMGSMGSISSYTHPALAAGESISFALEGTPQAAARAGGSGSSGDDMITILLGGAVLFLVAGGAAFTINNWRSEAEEAVAEQADEVESLLYAVASLDEAYDSGGLEESVYQERRAELVTSLAAIWDSSAPPIDREGQ